MKSMISFSIDKQRDQVNVEWMSRPVDSFKNKTNNQPLALVLTSMEQSPIFAYRLKKETFEWPNFRGSLQLCACAHRFLSNYNLVPRHESSYYLINEVQTGAAKGWQYQREGNRDQHKITYEMLRLN